jgi:predicted phage terminase large subunit-like protein
VIVGQRLGPEDLPGYVWRTYPEKTLLIKIPTLVDPTTGGASEQDDAVSQFPETWSTVNLLDYRKTRVGRFVLATTFQQNEATMAGNLIPVHNFARWDPFTATTLAFERLIIPVDTALKIKQSNDFSAVALWGLLQRRAYLIDLMHGKWESPALLANVIVFWEKWKGIDGWPLPDLVIEEKAAGTPLLQNLLVASVPARGIERDQDKVRRVNNVLPYIDQPKAIDRTAAECGSKVARNPKVKAEVARLRALGNVKTILSLNDRLGLLAKIAQTAPRQSDSVRAIEVYSKISGDQAPERTITEHTGKDGAPIQQEVAVSGVVQVVRLSVRDKMRLLREARERDKASHDRA